MEIPQQTVTAVYSLFIRSFERFFFFYIKIPERNLRQYILSSYYDVDSNNLTEYDSKIRR